MAKQSRTIRNYLLMGLLVLGALEICARILLMAAASLGPALFAENVHCRHDPILGWSNIPGIVIPDMYGPGRSLTINNQGFRANHDFARKAPEGKTRIVCVGDSFTLGYGVGDDESFCARLEAFSPDLEVMNMGQGGYGLDQMHLWHRKEWSNFDYDMLLVCFIDADISRMNADRFDIYPKPWMQVKDGRLHTMNAPAPDPYPGFWSKTAWWSDLGLVRAAGKAREMLIRRDKPEGVYKTQRDLLATVMAIFQEMQAMARSKGAPMAIVRLPTAGGMKADIPFFSILNREIETAGYHYFDFTEYFRQLPPDEARRMFIDSKTAPKELLRYKSMGAHYSPYGHAVTAKWMREALKELQPSPATAKE